MTLSKTGLPSMLILKDVTDSPRRLAANSRLPSGVATSSWGMRPTKKPGSSSPAMYGPSSNNALRSIAVGNAVCVWLVKARPTASSIAVGSGAPESIRNSSTWSDEA